MNEKESDNIIIFPDYQTLKDEIEKMRTELSMMLLERDELQYVICRNIETEYMLKLGGLEYKVYEAQCAVLRLKRKIELIQAKINRQEKVVFSSIEEMLDTEFAEYEQKINEQIEKMNDALERSKSKALSDEEQKEFKKIYRKIVKALHPDINPDVTEAKLKLLDNAIIAYKNGDMTTLRIIGEMISGNNLPEKHHNAMTQLTEEKERLETALKNIKISIDKIKSEYPYSVKEILDNPEKTEAKKSEFENILKQYNDMITTYIAKIDEMLR